MELQHIAEQALERMRTQGFDAARADASRSESTELNIAHNEPSLLRSTRAHKLVLTGIVDARLASTELSDLSEASLREAVAALHANALAAPQDGANALTAGQTARIAQGPLQADEAVLADKVAELLDFRAREAPLMMLEEGFAAHTRVQSRTLSSGGSDLACEIGWYGLSAFGSAREGKRTSSFNHADGSAHDLAAQPAQRYFGIEGLLRDTPRQLDATPISAKFVGDVVLTPPAVASLLSWLHGQIGDLQLIAGTSLYRAQVGEVVASPHLSLRSRFDAPGVAALSADGFPTPPVEVLRAGRLLCLTPSLYASRKTGLPHVPVAAAGWELAAGDTALTDVLAGVALGALVGRLSMGHPATNGDFSGVIKNSFRLEGGAVGGALREVMITGNVAQMLRDVVAVSRERIDTGSSCLPWLRVRGLHFS
ncbi:metallopeptidase TldD-related protein [Aquabacterium sp.]|uniref:metallopeptidase TldD-related protein n=1 Tax=Aquabacterium sp. TaxID=1872578 RepID=UPI002CBA8ECC|nr:metallopeptidase TldD-related protein [Aquabacterium sp.]HSW05549.1 metallopeptidase TldD-related protein [Aquabacterium sp.]